MFGILCVWLLGDAVGHVRELIVHDNRHPRQLRPAMWAGIAIPLIAIVLYALYRRALASEGEAALNRRVAAAR